MRAIILFVVWIGAVISAAQAGLAAEGYMITIPGQGWKIVFESPPFKKLNGESNGKEYQFKAGSEEGFHLSIFVEEPKNKEDGHGACFAYYWPLAKRNPIIDQESVKTEKQGKFVKVSYLVKVKREGEELVSNNVNYYFAFQDRWIDLHVSCIPSGKGDAEMLAAFEKSFSYQLTKDDSKSK